MAETIPQQGDDNYVDYVINLAKGPTLREGIINEPRMFYDVVNVDETGLLTAGTPGAFINGEAWPIRLTHLVAACGYLNQDGAVDAPENIQRIGLTMQYHDQFYMNPALLPLPVWGNKIVAAAASISPSTSSWDFVQNGRPFILSSRDTMVVELQAATSSSPGFPINVTFTGFGVLSRRPYILNSQLVMTQANLAQPMQTADFRNDGLEPIVITSLGINVGGNLDAADPTGAIGRVNINIRQVGNGTQARWFSGPLQPAYAPATLLGLTTGRAVVHQFPGDGLIWQPNEGITFQCQRIGNAEFKSILNLGLAGYLMVT